MSAVRSWLGGMGGGYLAFALVTMALCYLLVGPEAVRESLSDSIDLILRVAPVLACAVVIGGLFPILIPRDVISRWLGEESGVRGVLIGSFAGAITPAGPFVAFPVVVSLYRAGADAAALVSYLTAWSVLGLHRLFIWEMPLLGPELAGVRYLVSLPLPVLAGLTARMIVRRYGAPAMETRPGDPAEAATDARTEDGRG